MSERVTMIKDLTVVGYADVMPKEHGMTILAPIFLTPDSEFLFPPFNIRGVFVLGGYLDSIKVFDELVERRIYSKLIETFKARPEHHLWIDEDGLISYTRYSDAKKIFKDRHDKYLKLAISFLKCKNFEDAVKYCQHSFCYNTSCIDSLAIKIAIRSLEGKVDEVNLLIKLAMNRDVVCIDTLMEIINYYKEKAE